MTKKQPYKIFSNKIVYDLFSGSTKDALLLARKYKLPVILKYGKNNIAITPGDGLLVNNDWYIMRLRVLANYERIK